MMEKVDIDNFENIGKLLLDKVNEIVAWINVNEKVRKIQMEDYVKLSNAVLELQQQARGGEAVAEAKREHQ